VIYYFDTSALAKGYLQEERSADVVTILEQTRTTPAAARVVVSRLAYPETASAIARREREGSLSALEAQRLYRELDADFTGPERPYEILEPAPAVVNEASALVRRHRLRGFDAVHLASALLVYRATPGAFTFAAADRRLAAAAGAEGLPLLDLA
jgi:predicted nucleic acid-binding protein